METVEWLFKLNFSLSHVFQKEKSLGWWKKMRKEFWSRVCWSASGGKLSTCLEFSTDFLWRKFPRSITASSFTKNPQNLREFKGKTLCSPLVRLTSLHVSKNVHINWLSHCKKLIILQSDMQTCNPSTANQQKSN